LKGRNLAFQTTWFESYPWLHYNASVAGILRFYCAKANALGLTDLACYREDALTTRGFSNWKKALQHCSRNTPIHQATSLLLSVSVTMTQRSQSTLSCPPSVLCSRVMPVIVYK